MLPQRKLIGTKSSSSEEPDVTPPNSVVPAITEASQHPVDALLDSYVFIDCQFIVNDTSPCVQQDRPCPQLSAEAAVNITSNDPSSSRTSPSSLNTCRYIQLKDDESDNGKYVINVHACMHACIRIPLSMQFKDTSICDSRL